MNGPASNVESTKHRAYTDSPVRRRLSSSYRTAWLRRLQRPASIRIVLATEQQPATIGLTHVLQYGLVHVERCAQTVTQSTGTQATSTCRVARLCESACAASCDHLRRFDRCILSRYRYTLLVLRSRQQEALPTSVLLLLGVPQPAMARDSAAVAWAAILWIHRGSRFVLDAVLQVGGLEDV